MINVTLMSLQKEVEKIKIDLENKTETSIWKVNDGNVTWWVSAVDKQDALALVIQFEEKQGFDIVHEDWLYRRWPTAEKLSKSRATYYKYIDDDCWETSKSTIWKVWLEDKSRKVLACSEF